MHARPDDEFLIERFVLPLVRVGNKVQDQCGRTVSPMQALELINAYGRVIGTKLEEAAARVREVESEIDGYKEEVKDAEEVVKEKTEEIEKLDKKLLVANQVISAVRSRVQSAVTIIEKAEEE